MTRSLTLFSAALLASLAISSCLAKDHHHQHAQQQQQQQQLSATQAAQPSRTSSLASRLLPQQTKSRSARSLSDMFERVKSRIFGSKKSSAASSQSVPASSQSASQLQPAASQQSINSASAQQRQPWDLNALNQQFNPYTSMSYGQWPAGSSFLSQQFGAFPSSGAASSFGAQAGGLMSGSGLDAISTSGATGGQQQQSPAANQPAGEQGANGGIFSSASHLIAQYLSPSGSASSSPAGASGLSSLPGIANSLGGQQAAALGQAQASAGAQASVLTPQQQHAQSTYQDFASILDSMVAQTGGNSNIQRQPSAGMTGAYMQPGQQAQQQQQMQQPMNGMQQQQQAQQQGMQQAAVPSYAQGSQMGENDMSGSSNIQSYLPAAAGAVPATQQQASQKSSMIGLAEQLAPGANFNKLISFPFSLSNNDDQSKEGRYKLHIPFLNQHVKRSDQQQQQQQQAAAAASSAQAASYAAAQQQQRAQQQQMQQYISMYGNQQQQQQQLSAQASHVIPVIVSPQQAPSVSSGSAVQSNSAAPSSSSQQQSASPTSSSSSAAAPASSSSSAISSSSSSQLSALPSNPQSSVSQSSAASGGGSSSLNQRPNWSVADTQSAAASSKLIPIQSAAAAVASSSLSELVSQN